VLNKRGFNLSSRQPVARHVDDIVDTAPDPVVALVVTSGAVSSELHMSDLYISIINFLKLT
jgi:hypothetical protein